MTAGGQTLVAPGSVGLERIDQWRAASAMLSWLDLHARIEDEEFVYQLCFAERHIGNEFIRVFHGGVISSFLQACATAELVGRGLPRKTLRTVSVHCDFLRPAGDTDMSARTRIVHRGRRICFLDVCGWQEDESKPVGKAAIAIRTMEA